MLFDEKFAVCLIPYFLIALGSSSIFHIEVLVVFSEVDVFVLKTNNCITNAMLVNV